uniref:Uncharacterized protein n=1 Tax=Arundo donax TaxID=35708 RepID=A0A0A9HL62_ARUDO
MTRPKGAKHMGQLIHTCWKTLVIRPCRSLNSNKTRAEGTMKQLTS